MKRIMPFIILLLGLIACTVAVWVMMGYASFTPTASDASATGIPPLNMPNPASVYCTQNGNKLEIRTAADGSQNGICVFPNGSTCDEWAYLRGACSPAAKESPTPTSAAAPTQKASGGVTKEQASGGFMPPGATEKISNWWGVIKSTQPGAQFDDYFERQDLGQIIYFGIDAIDPAVQAQIKALRDSGKIVHLYGSLLSNVPDYNGSQVLVDRVEAE